MKVYIEDAEDSDLIALLSGKCLGRYRKLRSDADFLNNLNQVKKILEQAGSVRDLSCYKRLHYEQLRHEMSGMSSIRIGYKSPWRMVFRETDEGLCIIIIDINNHYDKD